jgi:hypothetical protein
LRFSWSLVGRPSASGAALDDPTLIRPAFVADAPGTYIVQLIVHDGLVSSAADTVRVTTGNVAPVADAGLDQTAQTGSAVRVSGVGSNDADGNELGFRWALIAQPAGSTSILFNVQAVRPALVPDRPGVYVLQLVVTDGMNISDPDTVVITTGNTAPTADAGPDQTIATGVSAILDGTRSTDVNGDPLTFRWTLVAHPINSNTRLVRDTPVTVLTVDVPGIYVASLEVGDGTLTSRPDTVVISSQNSIPVAKAGTNQEVRTGGAVTLDGTGSTDADFAPLIYRWSLLVRPWSSRALLSDAASPTPVFTGDAAGTYVAQLVVNDGFAWSPPATVLIAAVNRINHPPVANAGPDQHVVPGTPVQLDGRGSRDPDPDTLTFRWTLTPPPGSSAILDDPTSPTPMFVTDLRGRYDAQLVVSDGEFTSIDFVTVIANQQPTSSIVVQSSVTVGDTVQLDGQGSSDADGDSLTYVWTLTVPPSSKATLIDPQSALATFVADVPGDYIARLIVNDGLEASVPATSQIVASPRPSDSILCGETKSGTILSAAERDEFTFTGTIGEAVVFAAVGIAAPLGPVAELYDPNNVLRFRTLPNRQSLSVQLPVSGTYKIVVHDDNLTDIGNYNLNLQSSSGGCGEAIACGATLPGVVPGGTNQTGNPHAQQDSFTFIGGQNDAVVFAAVATSGLIAPVAELYDPNGVLRFRTLPNRQSLSVSLPVTGTYTIIVHDDNLVDGGSYNVNMHSSSGKCGTPIQCGETLAGALPGAKNPTALPHAQQDGYTFIATQGESVVFAALATGGTVLPVAELYDPNGVLRFRTLPNRQSLSVSLPATGTYTVIVHDDNLVDGGTYNINMHSSSGKCGAAIQCGQTLAGVLPGAKNSTTLPHAQQDGYTFTATQGEAVVFAAVATGGTVAPVAELYDPSGVLRFRTLPNRQSLSVSLPVTGTYTVVVHDDNLVDGGTYNVNVHSSSGKCGAAIQCGDTLAGALPDAKNLTTLPHAQQDGYTFIGTQGEAVVFAAVATGGTVAPVAELYDPSGVLRFRTLPNRQSLSVSLPATGNYTIIVRDDDLVDGGAYNVNLEFSTGRCAAELVCGIPVIGTISGAAEQDAYAFTGSAAESVIIEVIAIDATPFAPIAELYAPNGVLLFRTLANRASLAISLPATGRYTTLVHDDDLRDSGRYRIRYERVGGCPAPAVTVDPALIDFGEHEVGTGSTPRTVTVTNSGTAPLSITSVIPSGDFDIVGDLCSANSLLPGGSCTFSVRFTPTVEGPRSGEVSITSNAASSPHRVMLSGTGVRRGLVVSSASLMFGEQEVGTTSAAQSVILTNSGTGSVTITSVTPTADYVVINDLCTAAMLTPTGTCTFAVQFTPTVEGLRPSEVGITSNAAGSPHRVTLSGTGVRRTLTLTPNPLDFGSVQVGTPSPTRFVTVHNAGVGPVQVTSFAATGDFAVVAAQSNCSLTSLLQAGANCFIALQATATVAGPRSGTLTVVSTATNSPHAVDLLATGVMPQLTLTPNPLDFASVQVGTPSPTRFVTVHNAGVGPVQVTSFVATGDFAVVAAQSNCSLTSPLQAGANCFIALQATATVAGPRTGTLTLASTATNSPHTVDLLATGVMSQLTLTPDPLDFASVQVGTPSPTRFVTVHNAGVGPVQVTSFAATGDFAVVAAQSNCSLTSLLQAGANCFIALQATATVAGPRTGTLTLASTATNSPHTVDLLATGVMPQLTLTPNPLDFGSVQVGTPSPTRFVTVHNAGVGPVQVTSFAAAGDFVVVAVQSNCSLTS